jgi:MYXO-CTERM domain-containing protein
MRKAVFCLALLCALEARADGAFPTGMSVLAPGNFPNAILVGTTFGLVVSQDSGVSWRYACEPFVTGSASNVVGYQVGSDGAILAVSSGAISRSADFGCTWSHLPMEAGNTITDAFIDPNDPASVLGIISSASGSGLYPSKDGGRSFGAPVLPTGEQLVSVEIATSPGIVYATSVVLPGGAAPAGAALYRSGDGGAKFSRVALPVAAGGIVRIAAVDPADGNTVYLRISEASGDSLAITADGGITVTRALQSQSSLTGFARGPDRTLYAGNRSGALFTRLPSATTFATSAGPHLVCLGIRGNRLYACGDGIQDSFDLATSDDGGKTFQRLLRFVDLQGPLACGQVPAACAQDFASLQKVLASTATSSSGCGCGSADGSAIVLGLVALIGARRRKRR